MGLLKEPLGGDLKADFGTGGGRCELDLSQFYYWRSCAPSPRLTRRSASPWSSATTRYTNLPAHEQLQKAVNDARAVGAALGQVGFEVISGYNLGRDALVDKLDESIRGLDPGDTAFFFFSGHGVALDGVNYILPADMPDIAAGQETRLKGKALGEPYVIAEMMGRGVRVTVVVLDACRTNPFGRPGGKGVGVGKGLAAPPQVEGIFSFYAASSGQEALDRLSDGDPNPNSVFTRVLAPALTRAGVDLATLAIEVPEEVARIARTAGSIQRPAYYDETTGGRIYLNGTPAAVEQPVQPASPAVTDAERIWGIIQNTTNIAVLDDFIRQYGNVPIYGPLARAAEGSSVCVAGERRRSPR